MKIIISLFIFICIMLLPACQNESGNFRTWETYKGDATSSSYSSLQQINRDNVDQLTTAWTFNPNDALSSSRFGKYECNPIIIDNVLYATSARHRLYAIHAGTGKQIWSFDPFEGGRGGGINRGVAYWEKGNNKRILFTADHYLYAIDAESGIPIAGFGENGKVNLQFTTGDHEEAWVVPTSPGIVFEDLLIIGGEVSELYGAAPGHIRAFNILTGALEWTFHTIPHPGETGHDTWPEDAWKLAGGANNWGGMSLDKEREMVFIPLGSPTYDYYGLDRKGMNLFGNSIVALDANTGNLKWYFQTVHHDLWDYDLPAPPNLVQVYQDGKWVDALAQTSKAGFVYLLNRDSGAPLFPMEERTVPVSTIPGEEAWPTQPFPTKPAPYVKQSMDIDDLNDFSPEVYDSVLHVFRQLRFDGLFTPPDLRGTLMIPGSRGGSEWGGASYDPETHMLYINANESPEIARMQPVIREMVSKNQSAYQRGADIYANYCASCHGDERQGQPPNNPPLVNLMERLTQTSALNIIKFGSGRMPAFAKLLNGEEAAILAYLFELKDSTIKSNTQVNHDTVNKYLNRSPYSYFRGPHDHPALKPPWGILTALDLNTGEYTWRITLGNFPDLQKEGAEPTGTENYGGSVVTAGGLLFIGATRDRKFRAFDKKTGYLLWETELPGHGFASPATYMIDGRQYVVISVSGSSENPAGAIMAFALPQ